MAELELEDLKTPIEVIFHQIVANKITMGDKGRMLFLYKNTSLGENETYKIKKFKSAIFDETDETLAFYVKRFFEGGCKKVIVIEYKDKIADVTAVMKEMLSDFDWLTSVEQEAQSDVKSFAIENERFGVVYNIQADSIYVVSLANPSAVYVDDAGNKKTLTGLEMLPIIAGVCCGCPYNMSVSYKIFTQLESVEQPETYKQGQLTLYKEEEGIRFANACNTLQTTNSTYTEDMKSICIAEGMQRIKIDLIKAYRTGYKGKYKNHYDNQCLFYAAVNYGYIKELEKVGIEILDPNYNNEVHTNIEAQRDLWLATGKSEAENWDNETVCKNTYKNMIIAEMNVKMLDAMEGMKLTVEMF